MTRLVSGVVLAAAALAAILLLPVEGLRLLAAAVAALAAREFLHIAAPGGTVAGDGPVLLLVALTTWWVPGDGMVWLFLVVLAAFALTVSDVLFLDRRIDTAAVRFLAPWYIGLPLGMLVAVHAAGGPRLTLLLLATVVVSDSSQYYTGRMFGRHALAPAISPKKTVEGAVGGLVFGMLFLVFAGPVVPLSAGTPVLALLGAGIVVLGICGDLFESRLKRHAGVKDSSDLIPGHGGVLDRIDALLFAAPAFYLYLELHGL